MAENDKFLSCYISYPSLYYTASEEEKELARAQGDLFRNYIWGERGISNILKKLNHKDYGKDLLIILFQFYVNPMLYESENLKEIENYRKTEKSIGIPVVITNESFFNKSEKDRYSFLKDIIFEKLEILTTVIKKKKLDTNIDALKSDLKKILR